MIVWTPAVLGVLYACVLYFSICTCSAQLSMFHMERRSRNTLTIIVIVVCCCSCFCCCYYRCCCCCCCCCCCYNYYYNQFLVLLGASALSPTYDPFTFVSAHVLGVWHQSYGDMEGSAGQVIQVVSDTREVSRRSVTGQAWRSVKRVYPSM